MYKNIKLITCDLDGTLLTSTKQITLESKRVIDEVLNHGVMFVPCTGRPIHSIHEFLLNHKKVRYYVCSNGALICDKYKNEYIYQRVVPKEVLFEVEKMVDTNICLEIFCEGSILTEQLIDLKEYNLEKELKYHYFTTRKVVPNLVSYINKNDVLIEKINLLYKDEETRKKYKNLLKGLKNVEIVEGGIRNIEISHYEATKGNALLFLAKHLSINMKNTMAFGDAENDISMIKSAGVGVAMENAIDDLKDLSDIVTLSNEEDGVAKILNKIIVLNKMM